MLIITDHVTAMQSPLNPYKLIQFIDQNIQQLNPINNLNKPTKKKVQFFNGRN